MKMFSSSRLRQLATTGDQLDGLREHEPGNGDPRARARIANAELLRQLSEFFTRHDLDLTRGNLDFAHGVLTGSEPRNAALYADLGRLQAPVTQEWIDSLSHPRDDDASLRRETDALMDRAEFMFESFGNTVRNASGEAGASCREVNRHVTQAQELDSASETRQVLVLSRAMLKSLQRVEAAMLSSQNECTILRADLAEARLAADQDHLTGLPNRRAFEREFEKQRSLANKANFPICIAFCDIDRFKRINDTFGHDTGDRLLKAIADLLRQNASRHSFVARHGGEEFAILFAGLPIDDATARIETVRLKLGRRKFVARKSEHPVGRVTLSAGIVEASPGTSLSAALAGADAALYCAKQAGRNKVMVGSIP